MEKVKQITQFLVCQKGLHQRWLRIRSWLREDPAFCFRTQRWSQTLWKTGPGSRVTFHFQRQESVWFSYMAFLKYKHCWISVASMVARVWTRFGFSNLQMFWTRIQIQKFLKRSGFEVWKCDYGHLYLPEGPPIWNRLGTRKCKFASGVEFSLNAATIHRKMKYVVFFQVSIIVYLIFVKQTDCCTKNALLSIDDLKGIGNQTVLCNRQASTKNQLWNNSVVNFICLVMVQWFALSKGAFWAFGFVVSRSLGFVVSRSRKLAARIFNWFQQ